MKITARFILTLILILTIVFQSSCTNKNEEINLSVNDISSVISSAVMLTDGYYSASDSYFKYYFKDNDGSALLGSIINDENWTIQKSKSQSSENEFGVFITDKKFIGKVSTACEKYIETRKNAYMESKASYSPEEYEKFRDAEIFTSDNCVIYFIMKKSDISDAKASVSGLINFKK